MASEKSKLVRRWNTPLCQSLLVGFVLFCCPGMFNAINGMGAGGSAAGNTSLVAKGNSALYACFAIVGILSGSIINTVGPRICLAIGGTGYALYIGALWSLDRGGPEGFVIAAGAILGVTAALLWAAQGTVVMAYPLESQRSLHFAIQWSLLGVGACLGGLISLAQIMREGSTSSVSTGTYLAFVIIIIVGCVASLFLSNPNNVYRSDGTPVQIESKGKLGPELLAICMLAKDKKILLMTPAFLASNWFYAYQFGMNAAYFSLRARALNSALYWLMQTVGTFGIAAILDMKRFRRRTRGLIGLTVVAVVILAGWTGGAIFQSKFTRATPPILKDWSESGWGGPFVLYMVYGISDAMWQSFCYWLMSSCTNDPHKLARYAGWYKGIQSAGGALSFGINACSIAYMAELGICFGLLVVSLPGLYIVAMGVNDSNYGLEESVAVPKDLGRAIGEASLAHANVAREEATAEPTKDEVEAEYKA